MYDILKIMNMNNKNVKFKIATNQDAKLIKDLINQMYGIEYEVRENIKIAQAITNKTEVYILAYVNNKCIGFSGASLNNNYYADIITPDVAVIDYIYTDENSRNLSVSFELISQLLKELVNMGVKSAIMQVQTFNKQKVFHYALSDKNIIKSTIIEKDNKKYEDQILLIEDLIKVSNISIRELMLKAYKYSVEDEVKSFK